MMRKRITLPHRNPKLLKLFFADPAGPYTADSIVMMDFENSYRKLQRRVAADGSVLWVDLSNQKALSVRLEETPHYYRYQAIVHGEEFNCDILRKKPGIQLTHGDSTAFMDGKPSFTHEHYLTDKDTAVEVRFTRKGTLPPSAIEFAFVLEGFPWEMIAFALYRFEKVMKWPKA